MRILMLDNEYPPLGGGTGVVNQHLLEGMRSSPEVSVDLVTSARPRRGTLEEQLSPGIRVFKVPVDNRDIHHARHRELLRYSARGLWLCHRLLARQSYDVCFAFSGLPAGAMAMMLRLTHGLPYIVSLQGRDVPGFDDGYRRLYPLITPLVKQVWRFAGAVTAISGEQKSLALRTAPGLEVRVIHNGVAADLFRPRSADEPREQGPLRILCVGRLIERKGHRGLFHAFAELRRRVEMPLRLVLAGQGDMEGPLRALAQQLGIEADVDFLGYVPHERLPEVYRAADLFVLPSQNEGMSIALLEAMASGLPVLVTFAGGTAELVRHGVNGFIAPFGDVAALAGALERLTVDGDLRRQMSQANRERAGEFSWPALTRAYLDLCRRVVDRSSATAFAGLWPWRRRSEAVRKSALG